MEEARPHYDPSRVKRAKQRAASVSPSSSPPASPQPPNEPPTHSNAWIAPVVAVLLAMLATVFAYNQTPNPNVSTGADPSELAWWLYPYERNAIFNPQRQPAPPTLGTVRALRAAERGDHVFAVGNAGTILYSHDGGDSWRLARGDWTGGEGGGGDAPPESAATTESPEDIKRDILALTEQLERTEGAGGSPPPDTEQRTLDATTQRPLDADAQDMQETKPAPDTPPNAVPNFVAVDADEYGQFVAALADDGSVAISEDAGQSWRRVARTPLRTPGAIAVGSHGDLVLVASRDAPLAFRSRDRGAQWQEVVMFAMGRSLAASGGADTVIQALGDARRASISLSRDGLAHYLEHVLSDLGYLAAYSVETTSDGSVLYALMQDQEGIALSYAMAANPTWRPIMRAELGAQDFEVSGDGAHLAYRGPGGTIYVSADAGVSFDTVYGPAGMRMPFDMALMADGGLLLLDAEMQSMQRAMQRWSGQTGAWQRVDSVERYLRLPAPWLALFWIGVAIVLLRALQRRGANRHAPVSAIADAAISDSPLTWDDIDHLDFKPLALSVSAFIRNENTQAPLTIAVTGPWGTGKSSLMRLIEHDLKRNRFRPVWFNAWHAQEEQQLLAALLTAVRDQAAPPWWTPLGLRFRARMLVDRGWTAWLKLSALIAALAAVIAAVASGQLERLLSFGDATQWSKTLATLIGTGGGATLLIGVVRALTAFREQPAKLLAAVAQSANVATLDAQLSFRHRFAREFGLVTRALEPYTLTIFIDDLDRCLLKQVVDTLEAVNFLATAGQCVVVIGMARAPVEAAVNETYRNQFKIDKPKSATPGEASLPFDEGFAHRYLDKLINLEIPVPRHGAERAARLTEPATAPTLDLRTRAQRWVHRHRGWAALLLLALPLWFAAQLVQWVKPAHVLPPEQALATTASANPSTASVASTSTEPARPSASPILSGLPALRSTNSTGTPTQTDASTQSLSSMASPVLALGLIGGLLGVGLRERRLQQREILHDSDTFRRALRVWSAPVAQQHQGNPRALKRFVNWLRYLAMADRMQHPDDPMPEHILVTLAGLHRSDFSLEAATGSKNLERAHFLELNRRPSTESATANETSTTNSDRHENRDTLIELLYKALVETENLQLSPWPATQGQVNRFGSLCAGIVAR